MSKACIGALNYCLPDYAETNETLVEEMNLSWSAEDIYNKTGIKSRHIVVSECASDLGVKAAQRLFKENEQIKDKIDYIIFCSQSSDYKLPSTACLLQERLGIGINCGAIDINQGCSGFIYGLSVAKALIEVDVASNVLLITAETYSKYIASDDKSTRTIFGDGAAAVWITRGDDEAERIGSFVFGTDGRGKDNLIVYNSGARREPSKLETLFMDGPEIFQFTLMSVPKLVNNILSKCGSDVNQIDYFIFHQANAFILEHLRKKLKIEEDKFCVDMEEVGNTVSASIPIALRRAMESGKVVSGMRVMLVGFGVGYSWGGCVVRI